MDFLNRKQAYIIICVFSKDKLDITNIAEWTHCILQAWGTIK